MILGSETHNLIVECGGKNKSHVFHFGVMTPTVVPNTPHPTQVLCFPSIDAIQQRRCQEWRQTSRPEASVSESFEKLDKDLLIIWMILTDVA